MSVSNVNIAAGPRQVICETSENDQIPVDLGVLRVSGTFKDMSRTYLFRLKFYFEQQLVLSEPELVVEKDPLTQECKWFTLNDYDKTFFDVPVPELLELIAAADYLDIPRLRHYACQSIAASIKGKSPREICEVMQQDCDLNRVRIKKIRADTPWLRAAFPCQRIKNPIFIPNEVLVTIFEKLPREDLERLQLVSTQFDAVITNSSELSEEKGPLRVVTNLEFGASPYGQKSVELRDGRRVTCPEYADRAKRLKFSVVQKIRLGTSARSCDRNVSADIRSFSLLLAVKSAWKNATVEVQSLSCFASNESFEFAFTQLFLCKEILLNYWSRAFTRLPAIVSCNLLDISMINPFVIEPAEVVKWLENEVPPETKWSQPRQMILHESDIVGGINGLLTALKTVFLASSLPKPYVVRILRDFHDGNLNELLANEKTHERLSIRIGQNAEVFAERA